MNDGRELPHKTVVINALESHAAGACCAMWGAVAACCGIRTEELIDKSLGLGFSFRAR